MPRPGDVERVLVSVKGGETVSSPMIRDLKGTIERERAPGGLFVTLAEPIRDMKKEAASARFFDTGFGRFPKRRICTIAELLAGVKAELPPLSRAAGFRRAARETGPRAKQQSLGLD